MKIREFAACNTRELGRPRRDPAGAAHRRLPLIELCQVRREEVQHFMFLARIAALLFEPLDADAQLAVTMFG